MKFKQTISRIIKRRKGGKKMLSERVVLLVQKLYARGLSMRKVAALSGVGLGSVHRIISGAHPNQTRSLREIKKEESLKLYKYLRGKKHEVCAVLPPFCRIDWLRIKGRVLLWDTIVAEYVNGAFEKAGRPREAAA